MPNQSIIILSPHLDDAVLSCADHVTELKSNGAEIIVVSIFSAYKGGAVTSYTADMMAQSSISDLKVLETSRKDEDREALEQLGVSWQHLDLLDAGYRYDSSGPLYPEIVDLCMPHKPLDEPAILKEITEQVMNLDRGGLMFVPVAVGHHIDHRLVRAAAENCIPQERLIYYVDFPYAINPKNWSIEQLRLLLNGRLSIKWITDRKRKVLGSYRSQTPLLFRSKPYYPEVIITSQGMDIRTFILDSSGSQSS
jgi:LmbE family N-acetylglucosaminyl deacetylase